MIVGTKDINLKELRRRCASVESLSEYCVSIVPRIIRHNKAIVDNQKYLVAMYVRNIKSIPFDKRHNLCEELLQGVAITGLANEIYDFWDLMSEIDIDKLATFLNDKES